MEEALISVIIVVALAAVLYQLITRPRNTEPNWSVVVSQAYPIAPGAPFDDGFGGCDTRACTWTEDKCTPELTKYIAASERARLIFVKLSPDLFDLVVSGQEALTLQRRPVAIARIVASAQPLMYPDSLPADVFEAWYWAMSTVYYEPDAVSGVPPKFEPLPLVCAVQSVLDAELAT
jgi:hypothetical protein